MHRFNGWKHLTWTVESNVDLTVAAATLPHVRTHSKSGNFFTFAAWVGTTPGLCPGFCNLSTSFVFTAYSYVPKASNDKTKVDTWVHLGQQPQKTFNTPTVNSLTPVWPLFCQHPVPFSVLFFTSPFFYSDIYISRYERMIFCLLWFEQKTHTLKHNTITVMG